MKTSAPRRKSVYLIGLALLLYASAAVAQNEGIGTFSDLVGQAVEYAPKPQPTPSAAELRAFAEGKGPPPCVPPFFSAPTVGLEYDYRRTQQKAPGGLTIDVNEAHSSFAFALASTRFIFDYVHIWSDGSNSIGNSQRISSNGLKLTLTQLIGPYLIFSLPFFYKNDDGDAVKPTGPQTFGMDTFVMNPLMIFSMPVAIEKGVKPELQPLSLSVSSGYRLGVTQKNDIHPTSPDVDGWTGNVLLLAGADYAPKRKVGEDKWESKWKISGTATWNHLTNFYSSKPGPRPDDNGFGLGANVTFNIGNVTMCRKDSPQMIVKVGYQYDGFNRDQYQHSVTIAGTYRFW